MEIISVSRITRDHRTNQLQASLHRKMLCRLLMANLRVLPSTKEGWRLEISSNWQSCEIIYAIRDCKRLNNVHHFLHDVYTMTGEGKVRADLITYQAAMNALLSDVKREAPSLAFSTRSDLRWHLGYLAIALASGCKTLEEAVTEIRNIGGLENPSVSSEAWAILTGNRGIFKHLYDSDAEIHNTTENTKMIQSSQHPVPLFERVALIRGNRAEQYSKDQLIGFIKEAEDRIKSLREVKTKSTAIDREIESLESAVKEIAAVLDARPAA